MSDFKLPSTATCDYTSKTFEMLLSGPFLATYIWKSDIVISNCQAYPTQTSQMSYVELQFPLTDGD